MYSNFNKEDLIDSMQEEIAKIEAEAKVGKRPSFYYAAKLQLVKDMLAKLEKSAVLELEMDSEWSYIYQLDVYGLRIYLIYDSIDEEDNIVYQRSVFLEVKARPMTSEVYAELYGVDDTTVRQWIRRGKLPAVRKIGGEWRLTELMIPRGRGYDFRLYGWDRNGANFTGDLAFLQKYDGVSLEQLGTDRYFICPRYRNGQSVFINLHAKSEDAALEGIEMNQKEKQFFELKLLEHPDVHYETNRLEVKINKLL